MLKSIYCKLQITVTNSILFLLFRFGNIKKEDQVEKKGKSG